MNSKLPAFFLLLFVLFNSNNFGQIPSNGFEDWTSFGAYMQPTGWVSTNEYATGPFYAITRDTSHFPPSVGSYSIRLENNLSLSFPSAGGASKTGDTLLGQQGFFPITGHPTSLTGYYKFNPMAGDTMTIRVILSQTGLGEVATAIFHATTAAPNWTSFSLPIPVYANADSAEVMLAAFNIDTNTTSPYPQGSSVLYVDNLNFDNLITGVEETIKNAEILVYPNPATDHITIDIPENDHQMKIMVYNHLGEVLIDHQTLSGEFSIHLDISSLAEGIYSVCCMHPNHNITTKRIIVIR